VAQTFAAVSVMLITWVLTIAAAVALTAIGLLCSNDDLRCVLWGRPARAELPPGPSTSAADDVLETEQTAEVESASPTAPYIASV
jgi:hypothetical protein